MFGNANGWVMTSAIVLVGGVALMLLTGAVIRRIQRPRKNGAAPPRAPRWVDTSEQARAATGNVRTATSHDPSSPPG